MQHRAAWKVSAQFYHRHTRKNLFRLFPHKTSPTLFIGSIEPFLIFASEVDRAVEFMSPLKVAGVEVRMGDSYCTETSASLDESDRLIVEKRNAVPENITFWRLD